MSKLDLGMFIHAAQDFEASQYRILAELKRIQANFSHNRIYPDLAQLIDLYTSLTTVAQSSEGLREALPKRIQDIDLEHKKIVYERLESNRDSFALIEELIHWALPKIQRAIEEGKTMYEFVDENMAVEVVGILPTYLEEGYCFVPDNKEQKIYLIRYEVSIFTSADERYRSLKTTVMETLSGQNIRASIQSVKMDLIQRYRDLPNPATYNVETELEFPFDETILPVAKRKLIQHLYS